MKINKHPKCDTCGVDPKPIGGGLYLCPVCNDIYRQIDGKDHVDPQLRKEAGMAK